MASLFDNLDSSDCEDDVDYNPDEEGSSDDEEPKPVNSCSTDEELETKNEKKDSDEKDEMVKSLKEKANGIYESFLKEVESEMNSQEKSDPGVYSSSSVSSSASSSASSSSTTASPSLSSSYVNSENSPEKPAEVFEFAGETITVTKDGTILTSDSSAVTKNGPTSVSLKRKGLQSVLGAIQSKKIKVSTLDKSALDWNTFKKENGIAEELERFNKGKGGFVERQRFLERSDVRSFKNERDIRLSRFRKS